MASGLHSQEIVSSEDDAALMRFLQSRGAGKRMSITPHEMQILVIDDEKVSRVVISRLLHKCGYTNVTTVDSAQEGLKELKKSTFHLILADVKMPGMNGLEFLEKLAEDKAFNFADLTVVMVSAVDELQLVYQCLKMGASDFLTKPIRQETVQNLWQTVWRKRKEQQLKKRYQEMEGQSEQSKKQIEELQSQMTEAIKTPVKAITDTIMGLINDGNLNADVRQTLGQILKSIHSSNDLVVSDNNEMDMQTRQWLSNELRLHSRSLSLTDNISLSPPTSEEIEHLRSWDFDVWQIGDDFTLFSHIHSMFNDFKLLEIFYISQEKFRKFLLAVRKQYHDRNPYHNFRHAFDVTHMIYLMLTKANAAQYLGSVEVLAVLLSGLLHDVDHPGLNNTFQIASESSLALNYNDQSVLENHHCSTGYKILAENGLFEGIDTELKRKIRKLIVVIILGTDLSQHMASLSAFESLIKEPLDKEKEEHRSLMAQMIMKAADLSNPAKPFPIAKYWAHMVQEEFFLQGEKEVERGLPVSPYMARGQSSLAQMQINFADFIVMPIFKLMSKVLPELETSVIRQLAENRAMWVEYLRAEKETQQPDAQK